MKKNIQGVLSKKYGELDTRNIFDGIDDVDVENSIPIAESTIKSNIDKGILNNEAYLKLPNLRDGLAVSYAAAQKGNNNAASKAREAAYMEYEEPLVKDTGMKLLSSERPKAQSLSKTTAVNQSAKKSYDSFPRINKTSNFSADIAKESKLEVPENFQGIRYLNEINNQKKVQSKAEDTYDYSNKKSSTLDKYEVPDAVKGIFSPSDGILDMFEKFSEKDYIAAIPDLFRALFPNVEFYKDAARLIWKTGCDFYLRPKNYNISADMLEHSLQENPKDVVFYEDSDVVKKIKNNPKFLSKVDEMTQSIINKTLNIEDWDSLNFEFSDDTDLYYSIHSCNISIINISYNDDGTKNITVHITDNYDYTEILTAMDEKGFSPFNISLGSFANDMGTTTSYFDAINPYKVDIYFTIRR